MILKNINANIITPTLNTDLYLNPIFNTLQELGNQTIFYKNMYFSSTGFAHSRAGLISTSFFDKKQDDEILKIYNDINTGGYFIFEKVQKTVNLLACSVVENDQKVRCVFEEKDMPFVEVSQYLYYTTKDGNSTKIKITDELGETYARDGALLLPLNEETGGLFLKYEEDSIENFYIDAFTIFFKNDDIFYNLKDTVEQEVFFPFYNSPKLLQEGKQKTILPGHVCLYNILKNEENNRYFIVPLREEIEVKTRGSYTFSTYLPKEKNITVTFTPQFENILLQEGEKIKGYAKNGALLFSGRIEKGITQTEKTTTRIVHYKGHLTHYEYEIQLQYPPFIKNATWQNIKILHFQDDSVIQSGDYTRKEIDIKQFEIPDIFVPNPEEKYFFINGRTGEIIEPYILNPDNAINTEDELWALFYAIDEIIIPPNISMAEKRLLYHTATIKGVLVENEQVDDIYEDVVEPAQKPSVKTKLKIKLDALLTPEQIDTETGKLMVVQESPILSDIIKIGGYYYGVSNAQIQKDKKILNKGIYLFRTIMPGDITRWYDLTLGNYLFVDTSGFFTEIDYPVGLEKLYDKLLIIGTKSIQIWDVGNLPSNAINAEDKDADYKYRLPENVRFLGKYRASLPVGVLSKNMIFWYDNSLFLLTYQGMIMLNPQTYSGIPEIVRIKSGENAISVLIKQTQDFTGGFVHVTNKEIFIKIGNAKQILLLTPQETGGFNYSILRTKIGDNLKILQATYGETQFFVEKEKKVFFLKFDPHKGYDYIPGEKRMPIEIQWDFVSTSQIGTLWHNRNVALSYVLEGYQKELLDCSLTSLKNRRKTNNVTLRLQGAYDAIPDRNEGEDFLFTGEQNDALKSCPIICDGVYGSIKGEIITPLRINFLILNGCSCSDL